MSVAAYLGEKRLKSSPKTSARKLTDTARIGRKLGVAGAFAGVLISVLAARWDGKDLQLDDLWVNRAEKLWRAEQPAISELSRP